MNSKRVFYIMTSSLVLSFGLLSGAVVFGDSLLKKKSNDLMTLKVENSALETQQVALTQAKKDVQKYAELEKIAKAIVPQDKDQAKTVREIVQIAKDTKISIGTINFPTSNLGQTPPKPAANSGAGSTSTTSTATPKTASPSITQVKPVSGINGVYQMEISIASDARQPVPYSSLVDFLARLENNRRTAHVSNLTVTPVSSSRGLVNFNVTINVFIKP